jgi:hypothetical protein
MTDAKTLDCIQYLLSAGVGAALAWVLTRFKRK